ncbi:hypothetical protein [Nannocystis pusilla]|uniref:hypothetical protein n=1 Tax=Nannocystis pusilla TaxID=889268 RepID=UPI003DA5BF07
MERWRITAGHVPGPFGLVLVLAAVVLAIVEAARAYRKPVPGVSPRLRAALFALRCAGALCLLAVALELSLSFETTSAAGPRLVVLVDDSASMDVADAESAGQKAVRRIDRVRELWRRSEPARAAWKEQGLAVQVRRFGEGSEPLTGDAEATLDLSARQPASDLTRAFAELAAVDPAVDPRPLAGVIVISDGLFDRADRGADDPLILAARELGVPITAVAAGAPHLVDLALTELRAGEFAFVENVVEFSADIEAHGLGGTRTEVVLRRDGQVVATEPFVAPAGGLTTVRFEVAPDRVGQFVYEIEVRPVEGEASPHNNRRAFVVKVLRDKVRALHVAGRPDWDVRALRTLLGRDPNVELLSYYILRGADDADREDPFAPLSLIAFPTDELFKEQLGSFDLVILHNFDALDHQVGRYLPDIGRYVEEGGALVMIGGDMGLATGDYPAPALSAVVPVDLRVPTGLDTEAFKPAVTDAGRRHPITAWIDHSGLSDWSALPPLDSYNPAKLARHEAQIGSAVLLRHPEGGPLLTIAEPGRGRVLVLSTGASWRLGFHADLPIVDGARPYDLLWLGAIRWLLRDSAADRLTLETDRPTYLLGAPITLRAAALSPSYAPEAGVEVGWRVQPLGHAADEPGADPNAPVTILSQGTWTTDALGRASETLGGGLSVGAYEAVAQRAGGEEAAAAPQQARRVFLVQAAGRELTRLASGPGDERLGRLAEATGGRFLRAADDDLPAAPPLAPDRQDRERVDSRRDIPVWSGGIAMVLLVICLGGEVLVRRRIGLA